MIHMASLQLSLLLFLFATISAAGEVTIEPLSATGSGSVNVLVAYYSESGWTEALAREVAAGACNSSTPVNDCVLQNINVTSCDDIRHANALLIGSPVHFASFAGEVGTWMSNWQTTCFGWPGVKDVMADKVGGAFVTGGQ